ncbi:ATP-binding protein [Teredinibacter franksiae]|uniref:ATP-binding protein n=1 Tax=Teredinibacter franksiae TaxID=2761453 RepID=UPI001FE40327|nr:ATP-binding protein [Teredinibacter franksiae]
MPSPMIKSIKFKLWLTFLVTLLLSITAMLLFTHASVRQGFLNYATGQAIDRLQYLESAISQIYARELSLAPLENDKRLWRRLKYQTFREFIEQQQRKAVSRNEPPIHPSVKAQERAFIDRLILTDESKTLIVGDQFANAEYSWRALYFESNIIGYIGYIKPTDFMRSVDRLFVSQQLKAFALLSMAIFLASFFVSLIVSRWLIKPLGALSRGARKITSGDYSIRLQHQSPDELGQLCQNFNELARTLEANESARKQWVADISHEMRTPLAVIKAQIEAMLDGIRPTSEDNLNLLNSKINALSSIINDLYELSLTDLGALSYNKEQLDIRQFIDNIALDFEQKLSTDGLQLTVINQLPEKLRVLADSKRLQQLINNLLENSARYTDAPGKIRLSASVESSTVKIVLEDSAPSVPQSQLNKIFERLFRLDKSRNRELGGAGLGLSICKNIVEAHQGTILAHQSNLGGLTIIVTLPLH